MVNALVDGQLGEEILSLKIFVELELTCTCISAFIRAISMSSIKDSNTLLMNVSFFLNH